jgi:transposase InsO family protein
MSKARLVIIAVVVEKRSQSEVARAYGVSQSWISRLVARYRTEGDAAFEPRSRRPHRSPSATDDDAVDLVLGLRKTLTEQGLDAGAATISWHLDTHHHITVSAATVWRILRRNSQITPEPRKRPRSSYLRFEAAMPNQMWQTDSTHYRLAGNNGTGIDVEILNFLDDHSRYLLACVAFTRVTGPAVVATVRAAIDAHGVPASVLSDNGMVFTTRFSGGRRGRNARNGFEAELARHHILQKHSSPNHPQTCGKVERFHQTLKKWLRAQPEQPHTVTELQALLDRFAEYYNQHRPHRSLARRTPATAYAARPKATPTSTAPAADPRIRRDRIDTGGIVTLRHHGRLHHIGVGRAHTGTDVLLLVIDRDIRIINADTGELLRELVLDPTRDYQPRTRPGQAKGPNP